jgi:hypothetical protein
MKEPLWSFELVDEFAHRRFSNAKPIAIPSFTKPRLILIQNLTTDVRCRLRKAFKSGA